MNVAMQELDAFRHRQRPRPPEFIRFCREALRLNPSDGLRLLGPAPAINFLPGNPPSSSTDPLANRYLWVIDRGGIPYIIESPVAALGYELPKHTNLTGGKDAYLGGEMWFASSIALYVSGGSGRYPPVDGNQLEEAIRVFHAFGYGVTSLGWDQSTGRPRRVLEAS